LASGEMRNRVEALPSLIEALRCGTRLAAPGYDAATRAAAEGVSYDPAGKAVIVLDGSFAAHRNIRAMLDLVIFVAVPQELQRERFAAFYRWKGLDAAAIAALWDERARDEWPAVDAQRQGADLILPTGAWRS